MCKKITWYFFWKKVFGKSLGRVSLVIETLQFIIVIKETTAGTTLKATTDTRTIDKVVSAP